MISPRDLPPLSSDPHTALTQGQYLPEPMASAWAVQWDPREDYVPADDDDQDWIGEDAKGVWSRVHPHAAVAADESLAYELSTVQAGRTELDLHAWENLSAYQYSVRMTAVAARNREDVRRMKAPKGDK